MIRFIVRYFFFCIIGLNHLHSSDWRIHIKMIYDAQINDLVFTCYSIFLYFFVSFIFFSVLIFIQNAHIFDVPHLQVFGFHRVLSIFKFIMVFSAMICLLILFSRFYRWFSLPSCLSASLVPFPTELVACECENDGLNEKFVRSHYLRNTILGVFIFFFFSVSKTEQAMPLSIICTKCINHFDHYNRIFRFFLFYFISFASIVWKS